MPKSGWIEQYAGLWRRTAGLCNWCWKSMREEQQRGNDKVRVDRTGVRAAVRKKGLGPWRQTGGEWKSSAAVHDEVSGNPRRRCTMKTQDKTRQDKTRQDKTSQWPSSSSPLSCQAARHTYANTRTYTHSPQVERLHTCTHTYTFTIHSIKRKYALPKHRKHICHDFMFFHLCEMCFLHLAKL